MLSISSRSRARWLPSITGSARSIACPSRSNGFLTTSAATSPATPAVSPATSGSNRGRRLSKVHRATEWLKPSFARSSATMSASVRDQMPKPSCVSCQLGSPTTTRLENAHNTEFRELLYPWHPWSGLRIGIHEAIERPGGVVFRCDLTASDANRWLEIPAWMFDRSACAKVRLAVEPHTNLSALVMLGALLRDVRNKRSTASDAADSGLSPLSGDQNQGETHATPEQTEVGTPRAAANRPVRRERADHRRHAGLVRTTHGD